jgi:methionyl-tRNA formyltransferase
LSNAPATVVFMGSPDFAVPSLEALAESGRYRPALVVSQPDRPKGRGRRVVPTAVRARAAELGIPTAVMTRKTYAEGVERIRALEPDVVVVVAFGIIVKEDLLGLPHLGCVNVHASLLPRHRGVSPVQAAILAGDAVTGCTTMRIDAGIDTGDILLSETTDIAPDDDAGTLTDRLARLGAGLLVKTLDGLFAGTVTPRAQDDSLSTYTHKIKKTDGEIDWSEGAEQVARRVRAMTPWPSAYTFVYDKRLIVAGVAARAPGADEGRAGAPGTVVSLDPFRVACGEGVVEVARLQPEGGKAMAPRAYLAGHPIEPGTVLGRFD